MITLIGALCMLFTWALTFALNNSTLTAELPLSLWLLATISIHVYDTLDNLDGKQARRTGNSSPLGQLFDHGLDSSINTNATCFLLVQALRVTNVAFSVSMLLGMEGIFMFAALEEHYVGVCRTSLAGVGVTEYGLLTRGMYFLTWWYGYEFWAQPFIWGIARGDSFALFSIGISVWSTSSMLILVLYRTKSLRPVRDLIPFTLTALSIYFFESCGALHDYTMPLMLSTASVLGEISTVMIVCTMAKVINSVDSVSASAYRSAAIRVSG
jgi:ethanolaminephosphotransferase